VRATYADVSTELVGGMTVPVTAGAVNGGKSFVMSTSAFPTVVRILREVAAAATTAPITLVGEQTIDTVLTNASRVLVKNQANAAENGVYVSDAGAWTRATDADAAAELNAGVVVPVNGGSVNLNKSFFLTPAASPTVVGTTPLVYSLVDNTTDLTFAVLGTAVPAIYAEDYNFPGAERAMAVDTFLHSVN
jgi:phage-related tail fiber protein